ncbi:MAG: multiheme c-type cytochrome [Pseudomonadota bacterium]
MRGGLARKATYLKELEQEGKNLLIVDSGDLLFKDYDLPEEQKNQLQVKANLIVDAFNGMGCSAFNIGENDLALGVGYLLKKEASARFPFLSANLIDRNSGKPLFKPYTIKDINGFRVGIFGLITQDVQSRLNRDGSGSIIIADPFETAATMVAELNDKTDLIVALTHLGLPADQELAKSTPGIDVIIGGRSRVKLDPPLLINSTLILQAYKEGQYLGILDLTINGKGRTKDFVQRVTFKNNIVPLSDTIRNDVFITNLIDNYKRELSRLAEVDNLRGEKPQTFGSRRAVDIQANGFVGEEVCGMCHPKEYESWKKTGHARAYQSLIRKGRQFDLECIGCHTTGYGKNGGFSRLRDVGNFKGVQCEECHGPGEGHEKGGDITKTVKEDVCLRCHTRKQSPAFEYQQYLKAISKMSVTGLARDQ